MLSPGTRWQQKLGLSYPDALSWRSWWLGRAAANPRVRAALLEECAHDLLLYVNLFVWTFNPRNEPHFRSIPFVTYPFQDQAFLTILDSMEAKERADGRGKKAEDLVIQKSRDMGASWMSLVTMDWCWRFHPGSYFLMISRNQDLVDKTGDMDSLFAKLDFVHNLLPEWLLPKKYTRIRNHFGNEDNGSSMDGVSTTAGSGVGGRRTAVFIDEFSRIEVGTELQRGLADVSDCCIYNFTPWGKGNAAYNLALRARKGEVKNLELHWSQHPDKARGLYRYSAALGRVEVLDKGYQHPEKYPFVLDGKLRSPAYDYEYRRRTPRWMAQEWDIDYSTSDYLYFDRATIVALQEEHATDPLWEGELSYDRESGQPHRLMKTEKGSIKLWCRLDSNGKPPLAPYAGGADVSQGTGSTNSCFAIANRMTGEKVLEIATAHLRPDQFAALVVSLCRLFKAPGGETVKLAWERQGPGVPFGKTVLNLGYRHIFYQKNEAKVFGGEDMEVPGWFPSNDNKRLLLEDYQSALISREYLNRSKLALEECNFFVYTARGTIEHSQAESGFSDLINESDPSGAKSNHGDRVIADALTWKMCKESSEHKPAGKKKALEGPPLLSRAWRDEYNRRKEQEQESWI